MNYFQIVIENAKKSTVSSFIRVYKRQITLTALDAWTNSIAFRYHAWKIQLKSIHYTKDMRKIRNFLIYLLLELYEHCADSSLKN